MTPSQTAQISSPAPVPSSHPGTTGPGAGSRNRYTSATQTTDSSSLKVAAGSSPPGTTKFTGMPVATAGPSARMVGRGIPGELMMRPIGEGAMFMDEDSPTDSHYRGMPYSRIVREVPEDISEDGEWEADFDSKRSRASTLSSPSSVSGVLSSSLAGLCRKISDSKRIMKPLQPEGMHADLRIMKTHQGIITPSSGFLSPGQTSEDDDLEDDSSVSGIGSRVIIHGGMSSSHARSITRKPPPPLELQVPSTSTLAVRPGTGKMMSINSPFVSTSLQQMQSRSQSVPPKQNDTGLPQLSLNAGKPLTSSGSSTKNLELPADMSGAAALQAARLSSPSQVGQLIQQNRSISTPAMSSIGRSDSHSSSGTNNTPIMGTMPTNGKNNNPNSDSSEAMAQPGTAIQQPVPQNKYLTAQDRKNSSKVSLAASVRLQKSQPEPKTSSSHPMPRSSQPPFPDPAIAPKVSPAPASGMYWYKAPEHGQQRLALRAHTCTMVGSSIYVFGGCDRVCYNDMHVFDTDSMSWSKPTVYGDTPPPLRAMTTTAVGKKLVIFGGGDGPTYYNDVYIFDTTTNRYTKPLITGEQPSKRRAHTACFYKNGIYIFGGGDGERALDDVWKLDVSDFGKLSWRCICPPSSGSGSAAARTPANASTTSLSAKIRKNGPTASPSLDVSPPPQQRPTARGYHTANMVGAKLIVYGGSDGQECFRDVWVFDVDTEVWKMVPMDPPLPAGSTPPLAGVRGKVSFQRLSHTATIVGSYLFVVGGHDGVEYSSEVLLLNLGGLRQNRGLQVGC